MTTGCTIEAHKFQDALPKLDALNAVVLGVSLDTVESHKTFCTKDSLTFKLLADPNHKVIDAYGVPVSVHGDNGFAQRDTFLITPQGKIAKVWTNVNPNTHTDDVLGAIAGNESPPGGQGSGLASAPEGIASCRRKKARTSREEPGPYCLPLRCQKLLTSSSSWLPSWLPSLLTSLLLSSLPW